MNKNGNGTSKGGHTVGRKGFAKICAVEGVRLTAAMEADFRAFEKKKLPAGERRKILTAKYGKAR